jgi:membrane protein required for colicin V production
LRYNNATTTLKERPTINTLDIIILVIISLTTAYGIWKGMISQIFSIAGIVGGYFAAVRYYTPIASHLTFMDAAAAKILSFISIFFLCIFAAMVIAWIVGRFFKLPGLGLINSFGGGVVGFIKGFLVVTMMVIFLLAILPRDSQLVNTSASLPFVLKGIKIIDNMVPKDIKDQYRKKVDNIKAKMFKEESEKK